MVICLYGASSNDIDKVYMEKVFGLAKEMASRGHVLVYGGGAKGLMGAAARGATAGGGEIIGICPSFLNVDGILYDKCTDFIFTKDMRDRKKLMEEKSDAFIMVPGGIGTYEEFFEMMTLKQLGRHKKPIAIYNIRGYFDGLQTFLETTAAEGFMREESLTLYKLFDGDCSDALLSYLENYDESEIDGIKFKNIK